MIATKAAVPMVKPADVDPTPEPLYKSKLPYLTAVLVLLRSLRVVRLPPPVAVMKTANH